MFSSSSRCIYENNPLGDVICQLRFPEILSIAANAPVEFQEAIRTEFPRYSKRQEPVIPNIPGIPGKLSVQPPKPAVNHQFTSADGTWKINLTGKFISLSTSRYTCWESFAGKLDQPLAAFIQIYKPAFFDRVGLRYVNFISRKELQLEGVPFRELIEPCWLGPLAEEDLPETACQRSTVDAQFSLRGGCHAKIHAGPGMVKRPGIRDTEVKFIFDMDLFMPGQIPVNLSAGALQTLHAQSYPIFRGAITDKLHDALEPR